MAVYQLARMCVRVRAVHHDVTLLRVALAIHWKRNVPTTLWPARKPKQRACHFASGLASSGVVL